MFRSLLFSILMACAFALPQKIRGRQLGNRIVGGEAVDIEDVPYQVAVEYEYYTAHICGGVIISPNYVITAASCTDGFEESDLNVRVGSATLESGGILFTIAVISQHPDYDFFTRHYDISILELSEALTYSSTVAAISLPEYDAEIAADTLALVSGWGTISSEGAKSSELLAAELSIFDWDDCLEVYEEEWFTEQMICAGVQEGGRGACWSDTGGPLVADGVLLGIYAWAVGCADVDWPGIYTSVPALRDYITNVTGI